MTTGAPPGPRAVPDSAPEGEILEYRRVMQLLVEAVGWADIGAPFSLISPGPYWHPRRTADGTPDGAPKRQ